MDDAVRIGAAATALGVSIDTLRRWERAGRVSFERRGGQRYISAAELAELLRERSGRAGQAQRNRLPGVVLGVRRDKAVAQVDLVCGPHRIVSLMPREVVDRLALRPGDVATAVVRPSAVVVERD
jgi:excisionase family DNA binding protein